jgi:adenylosuccinate synthase
VQGPYCSISAFDRGDDYDEYAVCIAYLFVHPKGEQMVSNGRVFASGTIIKVPPAPPPPSWRPPIASLACHGVLPSASTHLAVRQAGEQLPTQQILHYCQPIVKKVRGARTATVRTGAATPVSLLATDSAAGPLHWQVRGWRETPIFARSDWWREQPHPAVLPAPVCELLDIIEHFTKTIVVSIGNGRAPPLQPTRASTPAPLHPPPVSPHAPPPAER